MLVIQEDTAKAPDAGAKITDQKNKPYEIWSLKIFLFNFGALASGGDMTVLVSAGPTLVNSGLCGDCQMFLIIK